jgi:hypothetical protein
MKSETGDMYLGILHAVIILLLRVETQLRIQEKKAG